MCFKVWGLVHEIIRLCMIGYPCTTIRANFESPSINKNLSPETQAFFPSLRASSPRHVDRQSVSLHKWRGKTFARAQIPITGSSSVI